MFKLKPTNSRTDRHPRGTATVEFAICLPVLLAVTFGSIELANAIYLRQVLMQAAFESGQVLTQMGSTEVDGRKRCNEILVARNIKDAVLTITPTVDSKTSSGTAITVEISAPSNNNSVVPTFYRNASKVSVKVILVRT